jgi:hypothetical protein
VRRALAAAARVSPRKKQKVCGAANVGSDVGGGEEGGEMAASITMILRLQLRRASHAVTREALLHANTDA